jgi:biotin operon repressor
MPETEHSQQNLAAIRTRLDNLESMTRFSLAARAENRQHVEEKLRARTGAAEAYLALGDGPKSQDELAAALDRSRATISRVLAHLDDSGLIAVHSDPANPRSLLFSWHDIERVVGVSKIARAIARETTSGAH